MASIIRAHNRAFNKLRPLKVTYDVYAYAAGSVLFEIGNTKVLCAITLQHGVPHFLRGKKSGWLTAEYSLLPASTPVRTVREVSTNKRSGRTIEISRLIGRALRSIIQLDQLGERTIFIDCDVLQADGGTRMACITGAYLALRAAQARWLAEGKIYSALLMDELTAVSVGLCGDVILLDMDFAEDSVTDADFNYVLTRSGRVVEIQGTAERVPLRWEQCDTMRRIALDGAEELYTFFDESEYVVPVSDTRYDSSIVLSNMHDSFYFANE
jgi:ribonuclease PH